MNAQDSQSMHPTKITCIDEGAVQSHIDSLDRGSIEETLNDVLEAEAEQQMELTRLYQDQKNHVWAI